MTKRQSLSILLLVLIVVVVMPVVQSAFVIIQPGVTTTIRQHRVPLPNQSLLFRENGLVRRRRQEHHRGRAVLLAALQNDNNDETSQLAAIDDETIMTSKMTSNTKEDATTTTTSESITNGSKQSSQKEEQLSPLKMAQTIGYRLFLLATTVVYAFEFVILPFLEQGTLGMTVSSFDGIANGIVLQILLLATIVLAPVETNDDNDDSSPISAYSNVIFGAAITTVAIVSGGDTTPLAIAAVSLREIYYFGIAYKVEAALCLLTIGLSSFVPDQVSHSLISLFLGVLVFGKFLEPLEEDWTVNASEFLSKNQMD